MKNFNLKQLVLSLVLMVVGYTTANASSHREAPLISNDPLADNVDVYAFRSPDDPNSITLIATYVPFQLPHGGPNYYSFGENIRYEIHVDNDASVVGDEVTYRFTFNIVNEDPSTFFYIRLGQQNQKVTYNLERSMDGGVTFETIVTDGIVPPNNIGDRSITSAVGLNSSYNDLFNGGIVTASTGETVFAGPTDDPFFVDLGGIFDLGDAPRQNGTPSDGTACYNVSAIAIQVPISTLLKEGAAAQPENILDPNYVIGVWASASRPQITTLSMGSDPTYEGDWVQVSRLGMPLTNEAVIPIGAKDFWNSITPYDELAETTMDEYFYNPELALYMDEDNFASAVPAFAPLAALQQNSLGAFDFTNGADGLAGLLGSDLSGTAFENFGSLLLIPSKPRSVDIWPIFHTGVPNAIPYQLATGKDGNPLAAGKPFINNFLPSGGDMLRLNMAVPVTPRDDPNFSSLGLVQAAAIGLTVAPFNETADLEFIPNMDGFPNGRRLEDDVTRIELQAVGGVVLAAVGLWYDDYDATDPNASPVTDDLVGVLSYTTGVESNDRAFTSSFPYLAQPFSGTGGCSGEIQVIPVEDPTFKLFVSSNTQNQIGIYKYDDNNTEIVSFANQALDADGIAFDEVNDVVYQLNRTDNVINAYSNVTASLAAGNDPMLSATSSSNFTNGREMAIRNGKLIVAQDANEGNGNINKFAIYDASPTAITFEKELISNFNLWGTTFAGNTLLAIEDNSSNVTLYENFLDMPGGTAVATAIVEVEGIVRTHGITYEPNGDIAILTDVGSGAVADDGAIMIVDNWTTAIADGIVTLEEQIVIIGDNTELGNPVDVAFDADGSIFYVAERANEGGKILTFDYPSAGGNIAPTTSDLYSGASAVYLSDCVNGNENGGSGMEADPVGVVYFDLDACNSNTSGNTNLDFSEFIAVYPNTISCGTFVSSILSRSNPTVNGHSCTPGFNGPAMCVGSAPDCDYDANSDKAIRFNVTVTPVDGNIRISGLSFYEKAPLTYDWINGPSGENNYPTQYGVRVLIDGSEVYVSSGNNTTTEWTLENIDFGADVIVSSTSEVIVELLGYCIVGNGATVAAWDVDEISLNATCAVSSNRPVSGSILTIQGNELADVIVKSDALIPEFPINTLTSTEGVFAFENLPAFYDYTITAAKDDNYTNGVSTLDLVLLQRHLLGFDEFTTVGNMIAGDINGDNGISAIDIVMLRKLVLGIISEIPTNGSWRFINAKQVLSVDSPYSFEEELSITNLNSDRMDENYIAIKVGDVNGTVSTNLESGSQAEVRNANTLDFTVAQQKLIVGQEARIEFTAENFNQIGGFQYTLDHSGMDFVSVESGVLDLSMANFNLVSNSRLAMNWTNNQNVSAGKSDVLFTIVMKVNAVRDMAQMLDINSDYIAAESYVGNDLNVDGISLTIKGKNNVVVNNLLFNNIPNPFSNYTEISFFLESKGEATLNIFDVSGKLIKSNTANYNSGTHTVKLNKTDLGLESGILYYQLKTDDYTATKKMIVI